MSPLTQLIVLSLATSHVLEVWRHGKILQDWRAWMETQPLGSFVSEAALCTFCFGLWVAWALVFLFYTETPLEEFKKYPPLYIFVLLQRAFVIGLAVARAANLINDLTYGYCRTPKD